MTELQPTPEAPTLGNYEEPDLVTRNEGMDGRSDNEAHRTDWLDTDVSDYEISRMELSNRLEGGEAHLKKNLNLTT